VLDFAQDFVSSHNDVSQLVRDAKRFSVNIPVIGKVAVPPPNHLAFYGVLAVLGFTELIPWPVAVGLGVGHALTVGRPDTSPAAEPAPESVSPEPDDAAEPVDAEDLN
jgi:hypothetical protein